MTDKQSRADSFIEAIFGTGIGFVIAVVANVIVMPWFGFPMTWGAASGIALVMTFISIARQFILRRLFNGKSVWQTIKGLTHERHPS